MTGDYVAEAEDTFTTRFDKRVLSHVYRRKEGRNAYAREGHLSGRCGQS